MHFLSKALTCMSAAIIGVVVVIPASAQITTYDLSTMFSAATSSLTTEDFSYVDGQVGSHGSYSTNNGLQAGPNASISATTNIGSDLGLLGSQAFNNPSGYAAVGANRGGGLIVTYASPVTAASLNVFTIFNPNANVDVSVYSNTNTLLDNFTIGTPNLVQFMGVTASGGAEIGKIEVISPGAEVTLISQLQYGQAQSAQVNPVPEAGTVFSFGALLCSGAVSAFLSRRRRQTAS